MSPMHVACAQLLFVWNNPDRNKEGNVNFVACAGPYGGLVLSPGGMRSGAGVIMSLTGAISRS